MEPLKGYRNLISLSVPLPHFQRLTRSQLFLFGAQEQ